MLWIRIGFKADPDPAFLVNADPRFFDYQKFKKTNTVQLEKKYFLILQLTYPSRTSKVPVQEKLSALKENIKHFKT